MTYNIALNFEDGVTRCHPVQRLRHRRRRLLSSGYQHPDGLPGGRLLDLQVPG